MCPARVKPAAAATVYPVWHAPAPPARGLGFPEFAYALQALRRVQRQRRAAARAAHRDAFDPASDHADPDTVAEAEDGDLPPPDADDAGDGYDDDLPEMDAGDFDVDVPHVHEMDADEAGAGPEEPESEGTGAGGATASYEQLCLAHIQAYVHAAGAREVQTELLRRVAAWRAKVEPALRRADERGAFDIQVRAPRVPGAAGGLTHSRVLTD